MVRAGLITMLIFCVAVLYLGLPIANFLFPWGGAAESYFKPIYLGLVALSGIIVGCTFYIAGLIKELKPSDKVDGE